MNYTKEFETFDKARRYYPGVKRGGETEFACFRKHKDWKEVLSLLLSAIKAEEKRRSKAKAKGEFVPPWKHFKTWINNRCWEETVGQEHKKTAVCVVCGQILGIVGHNVSHQWFCSDKCRMEKLGW